MTVIAWDGTSEYSKESYRAIRIDGDLFLSTTPISVSHLMAAVGRDSTYQFFRENESHTDSLLMPTDVITLQDGDAFYGIPPYYLGAALPAEHAPPDVIAQLEHAHNVLRVIVAGEVPPHVAQIMAREALGSHPALARTPSVCSECGAPVVWEPIRDGKMVVNNLGETFERGRNRFDRSALGGEVPSPPDPDTIDALAREVWKSWRAGMAVQNRPVAVERTSWDTLSSEDRELDHYIAGWLLSFLEYRGSRSPDPQERPAS